MVDTSVVAQRPDLGPVGIWTRGLDSLAIPRVQEVAAQIEEWGFGALWFGETTGREPFVLSSLLLEATSRLTVATGIANIWGRDPLASAAAARTLNAASGSRFLLGLGVSHARLVQDRRGGSYERPLAAMADYLERLAAAPYDVADDPGRPCTVIAALGPKMLETARRRADGAHPYLSSVEHVRQARSILGKDRLLAVELPVVVGGDADDRSRRARRHLGYYLALPNYEAHFRRLGFADDDFRDGGSPRLVEALFALGTPEDVLDRVMAYNAAGADHVCLQVIGDDRGYVALSEWELLAPIVDAAAARSR